MKEIVSDVASTTRPARRRWRALVLVPVAGLTLGVLSACTSKAGVAATVSGSRITEQKLSDYTGPNAQPISDSQGNQLPARSFVLQALIESAVISKALGAVGQDTSPAALAAYQNQALQNTTEGAIRAQLTKLGLPGVFYGSLLHEVELELAAQKQSSNNAFKAALGKVAGEVSVAQRYGSWDAQQGTLSQLSSKQVPGFLSYSTSLPGDSAAG